MSLQLVARREVATHATHRIQLVGKPVTRGWRVRGERERALAHLQAIRLSCRRTTHRLQWARCAPSLLDHDLSPFFLPFGLFEFRFEPNLGLL